MTFIEPFTDMVPSFFGILNQGPLTLTIFLHTIIILPMFFIYRQEKARLEREGNQQRENFRGVLIQLVVNAQFCLEKGTV